MQEIKLPEVSREFIDMYMEARKHLQVTGEGQLDWLRTDFNFPFRDHLSFRIGNRIFFILVATADEDVESPGSLEALEELAAEANGIACLMLMKRDSAGNWLPFGDGFSFYALDFTTAVDPAALVDDEEVVISDWELQRCATQGMLMHLQKHDLEVLASEVDPQGAPAIWFRSAEGHPNWIVIKGLRSPHLDAPMPEGWNEKVKFMSEKVPNSKGFFGLVRIASKAEAFDAQEAEQQLPLYRGQQFPVKVIGLKGHQPL